MDQLTKDCIEARKAGLTYGKYMAKKEIKPAAVRFPKKAEKPKKPVCVLCGNEIPAGSKRRKYCSAECADIVGDRQRRDAQARNREAKKFA